MNLMKNLVLIEPEIEEEKSGILLSEQSKDFTMVGTVKQVAKDVTEVKEGQRVIYNAYAAQDFEKKPLTQTIDKNEILAVVNA